VRPNHQEQQQNNSSETHDLLTYLSGLSSNTCIELVVTLATASAESRTFSLRASALQGMVGQHEPPGLQLLPPLVPKPKSKYRKSQAEIIKVAHRAGLIVQRLHPDGSVEARDNTRVGLTKQANGQGPDSWEEAISRETH
jgi:hypothetical protein